MRLGEGVCDARYMRWAHWLRERIPDTSAALHGIGTVIMGTVLAVRDVPSAHNETQTRFEGQSEEWMRDIVMGERHI